MKKNSQEKRARSLRKFKASVNGRLKKKQYKSQPNPIMTGQNIHYEMGDKTRAMSYGGIGAIHKMVKQIGLDLEIDKRLELLKVHVPYHESDHVLNIAYNALVGGIRLEVLRCVVVTKALWMASVQSESPIPPQREILRVVSRGRIMSC